MAVVETRITRLLKPELLLFDPTGMSSLRARSELSDSSQTRPRLFEPLQIRGVTFRNRVVVSPMCQYSCDDGFANDWHLVHLGSRAVGGAALVIAEATAVEDRGRISPWDLGLWKDEHVEALARITRFIKQQGAAAGIQLAHAGRKASMDRPWLGGKPIPEERGGWKPVGPSPIPFNDGYQVPVELTVPEIRKIVDDFAAAAQRSIKAGFEVIEIHGAHGYLLHAFYSPASNKRTDQYGGSFENRIRLPLEVIEAIRGVWPSDYPLFLRISSTDWIGADGWTPEESVKLARTVKPMGIDVIDCSSGGNVARASIPLEPGYQVPFAAKVKQEAEILTGAVGLITSPKQAEQILSEGSADLILLAREFLREPYWPIKAAAELGGEVRIPNQYARAFPTPAK